LAASGLHAGDALTLGRLLLTPAFLWLFAAGVGGGGAAGWAAGVLFAAIAASDYFDGPLARRAGRASERGRFWDNWADIAFLEGTFVTAVALGVVGWWVPAAVGLSFGWYALDSWWRTRGAARRSLVASRLGHLGGVANYVFAGVLTYNEALGLHLLPPAVVLALSLLVPVYSLAAIAARLRG